MYYQLTLQFGTDEIEDAKKSIGASQRARPKARRARGKTA